MERASLAPPPPTERADAAFLRLVPDDLRVHLKIHYAVALRHHGATTARGVHADALRDLQARRAVAARGGLSRATVARLDAMWAAIDAFEDDAIAYAGYLLAQERRAPKEDACWCLADGEPLPPVLLDVRPPPCRCDIYIIAFAVVRRLAV